MSPSVIRQRIINQDFCSASPERKTVKAGNQAILPTTQQGVRESGEICREEKIKKEKEDRVERGRMGERERQRGKETKGGRKRGRGRGRGGRDRGGERKRERMNMIGMNMNGEQRGSSLGKNLGRWKNELEF